MMKFFRKYNKHLLAIFMALLLIIWLGGTALEDMLAPKNSNEVIGSSKFGQITRADVDRANAQAQLLESVSAKVARATNRQIPLAWTQQFARNTADQRRNIEGLEWVLLLREAKEFKVEVSQARAKRTLLAVLGATEQQLQTMAAAQNVVVDRYYDAFADVLTVDQMLRMFRQAANPSELGMRQVARNALEKASVELVKIPAASFVDESQTFTDAELTAQFEAHRDKQRVDGGVEFGYYVEPAVDLQYIRIDPAKLGETIVRDERSIEKQAFRYWQQNQTSDDRFRKPTETLLAEMKAQQEATSNGLTPPPFSPYLSDFAAAREIAIEAVKTQQTQREANNIANELARKLADPWFDIKAEKLAYKAAPEEVKSLSYFEDVVASVPLAKRYSDAIEVAFVEHIDKLGLSKLSGLGSAQLELINGDTIPLFELAYTVEGLVDIPKEDELDRSWFISQWQTQSKPFVDDDGVIYLFRVTGVDPGHEPKDLAEVRERVEADLRLLTAMDQAKAAAESIAAKDTGGPLKDIWEGETDLQDKITPDKGGYFEPAAFARNRRLLEGQSSNIPGIGRVSQEFIDRSFELAIEGTGANAVAVEMPAQAAWAVVKGKSFTPLYEDTYESQKATIRQQLGNMTMQQRIMADWLNNKKVRERTEFKFKSEA